MKDDKLYFITGAVCEMGCLPFFYEYKNNSIKSF